MSDVLRSRNVSVAISLHWLVAGAVVVAYASGLAREWLPHSVARALALSVHVAAGVCGLALTALLAGWRVTHPPMRPRPAFWHEASTRGMHLLLYLALLIVPLSGLAFMWASARAVTLLGIISLPSPIAPNRSLARLLEDAHEVAGHMLMLLALAHTASVLIRHYALSGGGGSRSGGVREASAPASRDNIRNAPRLMIRQRQES